MSLGQQASRIFCLAFLLLLPLGCGKHTYPKEKTVSSVKEICRDEYDLDVDVKIAGNSIGTYIELDGLFDRTSGLSKGAAEHLGSILLSVSRVCLSTDADFEFYMVVGSDKTIPGMEAVFVRHVYDVKRFLLGNISRDDFFQRLLILVRFNPQVLARRTVMKFFSALSSGNTRKVLAQYLRKREVSGELSLTFLRMLLEMKLKEDVRYEIEEFKIRPLPGEKVLIYCRARESYTPKEGYTEADFSFPSGFSNEYLVVVGSRQYMPEIQEIYPLYQKDLEGGIERRSFPEAYLEYEDIDQWSDDDFLLEEITFPQFVAEQIAQRIIRKIRATEDDRQKEKEKIERWMKLRKKAGLLSQEKEEEMSREAEEKDEAFQIEAINGVFQEAPDNGKGKRFQMKFKFKGFRDKADLLTDEIVDVTLKTARDVLQGYYFKDFTGLDLTDSDTGDILKNFDKKSVLKAK